MFKILDGRVEFYQWDLERKLVVADSTIRQVHFCNRFGNCSLIRATYEVNGVTVVDVPNIILQESFNLHCYGYDVNYTKFESVFNIVPRTKPENYVNTEEELRVWDELEQKVIDLENIVSGEGIADAVERWLENNPVQAGATAEEAAQIEQNKEDIAQLRQEFDNLEIPEIPEIPEVNLDGYATEKYVDDAVGAIEIPDVSGYVNQSYVDTSCMAVQQMIPDVSGFATEEYVDEAIANIDIPEGGGGTVDLTGYATEEYVDNAIEAIDIPVVEVDKAYVTEQMNVVYQDITKRNYVGADYVNEKIEGLATEEYVDEAVANAGGGSGGSAVAVDNATIIQNADGTISTALGGSRIETTPATVAGEWHNATGITAAGDGWTLTEEFFLTNKLAQGTYTVKLKLNTGDTWYETTMYYDSGKGHFVFVEALTDWGINEFVSSSSSSNKFYFTNGDNFYQIVYITDVVFTTAPVYSYEPFDANYVPITEGHLSVNPSTGTLETPIGGYFKANGESVYHLADGNRDVDLVNNSQGFIGLGKNTYPSALYGGAVIGKDNNLISFGGYMYVFGTGNRANLATSTIIGTDNQSTSTSSQYISAMHNTIVGAKNTWNPTSSYYPVGCTIVGYENSINKMNATNSVIVGYKNSIRSSSNPSWPSPVPVFFFGQGLSNVRDSSTTQGQYHIDCAVGKYNDAPSLENLPFVVGMGTTDTPSGRKNGLTIDSNGQVSTLGGIDNAGADYAEYFEWLDGNPEDEDRVGYAVTLEGNKIRIANAEDDVIGFISGTAMAIGESAPWHWNGRFVKDEFGRVQFEEREFEEHYVEKDEEGNEVVKTYMVKKVVEVQNPEWNPEQEYIPRKFRAEWDTVGLLGKLYVRDDGSCEVGGYAVVTDGGIVTAASGKTNMRVLERTSENIVRVLFK